MTATEPFRTLAGKLFIDGALVARRSTKRLGVIDPTTEERIAELADASDGEMEMAIEAVLVAGRGWNAIDMRSRAVIMHEIAAVMRRDKAPSAEYLTREEVVRLTLHWGMLFGTCFARQRPASGKLISCSQRRYLVPQAVRPG